ncbi:MAG: hypothetical protein FJ095_19550 [Deltaproteobacteria bacterium]|nr:hypothetical protein [Deltaproteobacteria bacterium]
MTSARRSVLAACLVALFASDARAADVRVVPGRGAAQRLEVTGLPLTRSAPRAPALTTNEAQVDSPILVVGRLPFGLSELSLVSFARDGRELDRERLPLEATPCPPSFAPPCASSPPLRLVVDETDRSHPLARSRSLLAELGGAVTVHGVGLEVARAPVVAADGGAPLDERVARLRVVLVRSFPGGPTALGEDVRRAASRVREVVSKASALWEPCGIRFDEGLVVTVVEPPPPFLVSVGCASGLPASGGELRLRVDGVSVRAAIPRGASPRAAARRLAWALEAAGFSAKLSDNSRAAYAALPTTDVLVRGRRGDLATLAPLEAAEGSVALSVSSDATLDACIGAVDLADGLEHFGDLDASTGALEERTLLKALEDGDPRTVDVVVVPGFRRGSRIGESFIASDGGSLMNAVIVDRAGMRDARAAVTLAHELGHVLLDDPGHSDDFGGDTPSSLMDGDANDGSAFGPRRLSARECTRARLRSGPGAAIPLLAPRSRR